MLLIKVRKKKKRYLCSKVRLKAQEGIINLEYYMTEKAGSDNYLQEELVIYGVEVKKTCTNYISNLSDEILSEVSCFNNISSNKESVISLINVLSNNFVTPITLEDTLQDMCGIHF